MPHHIDDVHAYCKKKSMRKSSTARVLVTLRPDILDVQGQTIHASLQSLGFENIKSVRVGKLIEIESESELTKEMMQRIDDMAHEILANPIIEDFKVEVP